MLNIHTLTDDQKDRYRELLDKRKENADALCFLKSLDETDDSCFLTGKAGTGKSTLIKDVIEFCSEIGRAPLVL